MALDPFQEIYSGHLDASGRKQNIREHREGKASRKTFELLVMCQERMTMLHGQWWLWSACGDLEAFPCKEEDYEKGIFHKLSKLKSCCRGVALRKFSSGMRKKLCERFKLLLRRRKAAHDLSYNNPSRSTTLHWHVSGVNASLLLNMLTTHSLKRCILILSELHLAHLYFVVYAVLSIPGKWRIYW